MDRLKELVEILNTANKAYHQQNTEIMSNNQYDALYDELNELEKTTGITLSNSPTTQVGYETLKTLKKVAHTTPLLSLDKTKEIDALISFLGENNAVLSYKLDGLTVLLAYENGDLVQALTRGNGTTGEDITHNAIHFKNLPKTIPYKGRLHVRGEAAITYTDFEKINESLADNEKYKNPRNLCSGTVRQLDSSVFAKRNVRYFAFTVMECDKGFEQKSAGLEFLAQLGFDIVEYKKVNANDIVQTVERFKQGINALDIPTDGLVLTYDNIAYSESLGTTSKFPKDSLAFKWRDQTATTSLLGIEWNTSRTGLINPIAVFEDVDLEGSVVKKASIHNLSIVEELALGIGDKITVYKANMIIPQIAQNLSKTGPMSAPTHCSSCNAPTKIVEQNAVKTLYCTNPNCNAKQVGAIVHYASRNAMNIEGLSEATITKFLEQGFIKNFADIYDISEHSEKIKNIEGLGEKSLSNLLASIERSKQCRLDQFIYGLGIANVGMSAAKLLCKHCDHDIENIKKSTPQQLIEIEGFGDVIANSITEYFADKKNQEMINIAFGNLQIKTPKAKEQTLQNLTFVITGSLEKFKNRKELQELIESKSAKVTSAVTKNTNYLINNDNTSESGKNKTAKKLGIPVITEAEFLDML